MRGLPEARAEACLSDQAAIEKIVGIGQAGTQQHGISGTPSFLINGELVEGVSTWDALEPRIRGGIG